MTLQQEPKCFGLIAGLGTPSSLYYYQALIKAYEARSVPARFFVANADFSRVTRLVAAGDASELADYFASLIQSLAAAGAEFVALSAVLPHICMPELRECSPLPVLDIIEVSRRSLRARGAGRVALLGTRIAMTSRLFGRLEDVDVIDLAPRDVGEVQRIYTSIQVNGCAAPEDASYLRVLGQALHDERGAQFIVVAGTDLSVVLREDAEAFPILDCAKAHVQAIVEWALNGPDGP